MGNIPNFIISQYTRLPSIIFKIIHRMIPIRRKCIKLLLLIFTLVYTEEEESHFKKKQMINVITVSSVSVSNLFIFSSLINVLLCVHIYTHMPHIPRTSYNKFLRVSVV